ncbi:acyltransferase family protein [Nocardia higoensis]|uniref:acyltransferase family protein n=1 Tax=Nocardia higoensis TaxID=228599 RepID=UPI0003188583|nr:acyltransferase family protein [Nocardia higoensis]
MAAVVATSAVPATDTVVAPGAAPAAPAARVRPTGYRTDLDGLRGVAIALVVVFHIWMGRVSGGVDVFLVLAGFFFTASLLRRAGSDNGIPVRETLARLARRLLPALVLVLATVALFVVLTKPYTQWTELASQTLASLLYYQNWYLAFSWADYLAADPSVSPLQHLWSMSLQGQFYLAALLGIAVLVWTCRTLGRPAAVRPVVAFVLAVLAAASFVYAARGVDLQQGWNYYDSFARAWELLAGALVAVVLPGLNLHRAVRLLLALAGATLVAACGWIVDGSSMFPGPAALIPVGATVALILAGQNLSTDQLPLPNRLLASSAAVRLGEMAYALYLWHWPLLIFVLAHLGNATIGVRPGLAVLAVSLVLAYLTHRFVEEPLRAPAAARPPRVELGRRMMLALGVTVLALTVTSQVITSLSPPHPVQDLDALRYPGAEALVGGAHTPHADMRPSVFEAPADAAYPTRDGCISDWDTREVITCSYGDPDADRTIAVVGNSHAEHWVPALDILGRENGVRIDVYLKMGCPLTVAAETSYKGQSIPDCRDWSLEVIDRLGVDRPDWVFTTGTRPRDLIGDETPDDYVQVWSRLSEHGLNILAIRDTPWLRRDGVRYRAIDCLAENGDRYSCGILRADAFDPANPADGPAASFPNVFTLDLTDAVCEPDICPVVVGNTLVYHDEHHLTASYSRSLAPELGRKLGPILGWW